MSKQLKGREFWLDHDKKVVQLDGKEFKLTVSTHEAIYPVPDYTISVYLNPVDKEDEEYLQIKEKLRGDWSTNVLDSEPEIEEKVLKALGL